MNLDGFIAVMEPRKARPVTFAECPDCGSHYYWNSWEQGAFSCAGCRHDRHTLLPQDIYLEHDERAALVEDNNGELVLGIVTIEEA